MTIKSISIIKSMFRSDYYLIDFNEEGTDLHNSSNQLGTNRCFISPEFCYIHIREREISFSNKGNELIKKFYLIGNLMFRK